MSVGVSPRTVYDRWSVEIPKEAGSWEKYMESYTIELATSEDAPQVTRVAQEAYFHPEICRKTSRDPSYKQKYLVDDVPKRIEDSRTYKVIVCKKRDQVIGTAYYKFRATWYAEQDGKQALAEIGTLAVHPTYWGKGIGEKLIKRVEGLARADKIRAIYLYAIASRDENGKYSSSLPAFYERQGFKFISNDKSGPHDCFTTPDKCINSVLMIKDLSSHIGKERLQTIYDVDGKKLVPIPKDI